MACECGHLFYDHRRGPYSAFSCTRPTCACRDYAEALSDAETAEDCQLLLFSDRLASDET